MFGVENAFLSKMLLKITFIGVKMLSSVAAARSARCTSYTRYTTNRMCAKDCSYMYVVLTSTRARRVISAVCCHNVKLCAFVAQAFRLRHKSFLSLQALGSLLPKHFFESQTLR